MEAFQNFQHLLTHVFSSSSSPEAVVESNESTNESLDPESPLARLSSRQQETQRPSDTEAVGASVTSTGNGQDSENPQRRLSSQQHRTEHPGNTNAVGGSNTSTGNSQGQESPRRRVSSQQQQTSRSFRVSKTPSPPLRRSPRLTNHIPNSSSNEAIDSSSSQRPTDRASPRTAARTTGPQQQQTFNSRVSKPSSPPILHRSPRNTDPRSARHGSIPYQCCEYVDEATKRRCGNFDGFRQIDVFLCETEDSPHHREFGDDYRVCEPCRTRVS